jgi:hypothetical protein
MSDSPTTSAYLFSVFALAAVVCGGLVIWSFASGTFVDSRTIQEPTFENESFSKPHMTFTLDQKSIVQLDFEGTTLNDSWVWVKALLIDDQNDVLGDYTFELQEYSDSDNTSWSTSVILPAGTYKILVHGQDAKRSRGWTDEHSETIRVSVSKDFVLTRYGLIGLVVFGIGALMSLVSTGGGSDDDFDDFD